MQGDIRQRISLEGDDEIKKRLSELGKSGEADFKRIHDASEASSSSLGGFSNVMARVRTSFAAVGTSFTPVVHQFKEMHESVAKFSESMMNTAERILPNFKEVITLGTAAGVAGLVEFITTGAHAAKEIGDMSKALGMSADRFQAFKGAAAAAGIEQDKFVSMLARFAGKVTESANSQLQEFGSVSKMIFADTSTLGTQLLKGTVEQAQSASASIIRGNMKLGEAGQQNLVSLDDRITSSVQRHTALGNKLVEQANIIRALWTQAGNTTVLSTAQIAQNMANVAARGDAAGKSMRDLITSLGGAGLVPATNAFEALDRYTQSWQKSLANVVTMWKNESGQLVPKNLEEAFMEVADKVKAMQPTEALSFVRANFGRDSTKLIEILRKGSDGIKDMTQEFTHLGMSIAPVETELGAKLVGQLEHLETAVMNIRTVLAVGLSPALSPAIEGLTHAIAKNVPAMREWAESISKQLAPGLKELTEYMEGATESAHIESGWVKTLISTWDGLAQAIKFVSGTFQVIIGVLDVVATGINKIFNTEFSGGAILAVLAIGKVTGAFGLMSAATNLALDAFMLLVTKPLVGLINLAAKAGLIRAAIVGISTAWTAVSEIFALGTISTMFAPLLTIIGPAGLVILAIVAIGAALITFMGGWDKVFKFLQEGWDNFVGTLGAGLNMIKAIIEYLGRAISDGNKLQSDLASAGSGTGQYAAGGQVHGPGGIDNVNIWATAGEYVMKTAAVAKYGVGLMHAINSLAMPRHAFAGGGMVGSSPISGLPQPVLRYAGGGMVPSITQPGATLNLTVGDQEFRGLYAPEHVASQLIRFARTKSAVSAGRKQGWSNG